jgi:hypothetical protein
LVYFYTCGFRRTSPIVFRKVFNLTWLFSFFLYLLILLLILLLDCLSYRHVLFLMSLINLLLKILLPFLCKDYVLMSYILSRLIWYLSWNSINIVIFWNIIEVLVLTGVNLYLDYSILRKNIGHRVLLLNHRYAWNILKVNPNRDNFFIWNLMRTIFMFSWRSV